jgi:leucyl aminopeptidase
MQIQIEQGSIQQSQADTIVVNLFEGVTKPGGATGAVDQALDGAISELIANGDLSGKVGETAVLYPRELIPARRVIVVGLGKQDDFDLEGVRRAAAAGSKRARQLKAKNVATIIHGAGIGGLDLMAAAQATIEGSSLALYRYDAPKQKTGDHQIERLTLVEYDESKIEAIESAAKTAQAISDGVALARDLVNMPPNVATPTKMAETATAIAQAHGLKAIIGDRAWAAQHKMGAFLAVAQGAGEPPQFIIMEHNGSRDDLDTIVLVGKGITFDTGGISIKPTANMGNMKSDMGGAAAVLGAIKAVAALDLPLRVIAITPCTENMPDANAYRPADVITASNGKTIEIISTDAEGRLVLADGLVFAGRYQPKAVVDLATLTGSCIVALGMGMAAGLFSNDEDVRRRLETAASQTHERVWSFPLWDDYRQALDSDVADMKNSGGRMGGVATSAIFLKEFTDYPWAHLDIAGMALSDKENNYITKGGTGYGVRLLVAFLQSYV